MASLFAPPKTEKHRTLPAAIRDLIRQLKAEHPPFRAHEIATICGIRLDHRPRRHTVKRILAEDPPVDPALRRYPPYHQIPDPAEARLAIIHLYADGWNIQSIAAYLEINRSTVYATLCRWAEEGVWGLEDKSHARKQATRKTSLQAMATIQALQRNPEVGAFRIHAALQQLGIALSPRTCGRILAHNRMVYGLQGPTTAPHEPKAMPFQAVRRHQYWTVDLRYIDVHQLGGDNIYCVSILENYSRAILASGLSRSQDLTAYFRVLYAAIRQHGSPEARVSDSGSVFKAKQAMAVYEALGIKKAVIQKRQPWQSYIETAFNIQRRMADWDFAQAPTWAALLGVHGRWVVSYNYQSHWAHRQRTDGKRSPANVLGWVSGLAHAPEELHRIFYRTRFGRRLDRAGYVRFRHRRLYAERGLLGEHAAVWLYGEHLTLEFADEPLAAYALKYAPDGRHLAEVTEPRLYETPHRSPQQLLWEDADAGWLKMVRVPTYAPRRRRAVAGVQGCLFPEGVGQG